MSILISGSIAFDTIIQTVGNFRAQDSAKEHDLHLSLFAPVIRREYGGTAANIAYSLALLGRESHLIASIGEDGRASLERLAAMGVHTELVNIVPGSYSPQAYILRDEGNGQISTFHPGAMSLSGELTHGNVVFDYVIVSPDSREAMLRRVDECTKNGSYTIFDPGQAMGLLSRDELKHMTIASQITIMNEPEREQFQSIVGEDVVDISLAHGRTAIITLGEKGSCLYTPDQVVNIPATYTEKTLDATGCGDAFRSGLLYGLSENWSLEKSCKLGITIACIKIASQGSQNHTFDRTLLNDIGTREFGEKFFD